jgi:hypothetical protein
MSISNIQNSNISSLLSKAYNTDNSAATGKVQTTDSKQAEPAQTAAEAAAESAKVILGGQQAPQTYTAQGLMQQLRQYQLDNTSLIFGDSSDDTSQDALPGMLGNTADDTDSSSQDWASTISKNPSQAAVMVERSKSNSLNTIFNNK